MQLISFPGYSCGISGGQNGPAAEVFVSIILYTHLLSRRLYNRRQYEGTVIAVIFFSAL
jgi:hypothetical protein